MANRHHHEILERIRSSAGKATQHTFLDSYLGTTSPRYAIGIPALRKIAKNWMHDHPALGPSAVKAVVTALMKGKSSTEKTMGGLLLDYTRPEQRQFDPVIFESWIGQLSGWAEVDALCSGKYTVTEVPAHAKVWARLLTHFSKSRNIHHRRASLVLLVAPLRNAENIPLATIGLKNILRLKNEKEILITKAISWLLRTMIKKHNSLVREFMAAHGDELPAIAVRETMTKLKTGRKTKRRMVLL